MPPLVQIVHEDDALLVLHKPAGLVCHPTKGDAYSSLVSRVRLHLGTGTEPQMVHRLDRETSGLIVFGKTSDAAAELRRLWSAGLVTKQYLALVHGHPAADEGTIDAPLGPDLTSAIALKDAVRSDGAAARTRFRVLTRFQRPEGPFALLALWLDTGRKHQIRIHLAHLGHPIIGDKLYGGDESLYLEFVHRRLTDEQKGRLLLPCQALHAGRLWFPWEGVERGFEATPEPWFTAFMRGESVPWLVDLYDPQIPGG